MPSRLAPVDYNGNEIRNVVAQSLASFPSHAPGKYIYYTGGGASGPGFYWSDGAAWHKADASTATVDFGPVVPQTTFGAASSDGSGTDVAHANHTHGTPVHNAAAHAGMFDLDFLSDVAVSAAANGDALVHNGTSFVNTPFDTRVRTSRLDQMAAPTAAVSLNNQKITNLGTPTAGSDAVTKTYADGLRQGLSIKDSVDAASTANVNTAAFSGNTMDGVTLAQDDRLLLKDQTTASQRGIWVFNGAGNALTRAVDADATGEITVGTQVFVKGGTVNGGQKWIATAIGADPWVPGTDSSTWTQDSGASALTAGAGLTATGNVFAVGGTTNRITVAADSIDIAATYVGQTSITTLGTITTGVWNGTAVPVANGGTGSTTAAAARTALGTLSKYETTIGDGVATSIVVTHNLGTRGVQVVMYLNSGTYAEQEPDIEHSTTNTITLKFTTPPTSNQYAVAVFG